jgi:hypothetical protein
MKGLFDILLLPLLYLVAGDFQELVTISKLKISVNGSVYPIARAAGYREMYNLAREPSLEMSRIWIKLGITNYILSNKYTKEYDRSWLRAVHVIEVA